jgi:ubiquinone/menaquinone biosynthesis C-methylase UbiE
VHENADRPPGTGAQEALRVTIDTYDATAAEYAERTLGISMNVSIRWFVAHLPARARILDAGCGPGRDVVALRSMGYDVFGLDLSAGMLAHASQRAPDVLVQGDLTALPLDQGSFQGVWACASLLHLPKPAMTRALAELRRVLADGVVYIAVKQGSDSAYVPYANGRERYFAYYSPDELRHLVERSGFRVIETRTRTSSRHPDTPWIHLLARVANLA